MHFSHYGNIFQKTTLILLIIMKIFLIQMGLGEEGYIL